MRIRDNTYRSHNPVPGTKQLETLAVAVHLVQFSDKRSLA